MGANKVESFIHFDDMETSVFIYEDNKFLRSGIESLLSLEGDIEIMGAFSNCLNVAEEVKSLNPRVILMDIQMPDMTGIEAVKAIRAFNKETAIIMLTVFDDNKHILDAICAGASGYLLKKHISENLLNAIKEVLEGGAPMSPAVAKMVVQSMHKNKQKDYQFNRGEKEILNLLCQGNSYKMIAAATGYTFETIRSYIKNMYLKLEVHSATEAVLKAVNEKLI